MHVEYTDSVWSKSRKERWENDIQYARKFATRISKSIEYYLGRPVQTVLEIGCSSGFMGIGFNSLGCAYTGVDIDPESIEFAKSKGIDAYCLSAEDIEEHTLPRSKYDFIISSHVFEHLDDPHKAFQNLGKICGGIIAIIVPNPKGLFAVLRSNKSIRKLLRLASGHKRETAYSIDGCGHNIACGSRTLEYLCAQTGFEPLKIAPMDKYDHIFGFVQRNYSFKHKLASSIAGLLGMENEIILIARPKSP